MSTHLQLLVSTNFAARLVSTHFLASGLVVTNIGLGPFLLGPFSVAFLYTNMWITFLLLKCYVGHVGYVVMGKKSLRIPACAPILGIIAI